MQGILFHSKVFDRPPHDKILCILFKGVVVGNCEWELKLGSP